MATRKYWKVKKAGLRWAVRGGPDGEYGAGVGPFIHKSDATQAANDLNRSRKRERGNPKRSARKLMKSGAKKLAAWVRAQTKSNRRRKRNNPVRVAASMSGKSTGWIPAKAVKVIRGKGGKVRVDIKR